MKVNPSIFKSYDIRGLYPNELNEEAAFKIGQAFANYVPARSIVAGRDGRLSSPALFSSLIKGITSQGKNVHNIGETPTEGMYFAASHYDFEAGIMITASHNPKAYNGFKMIKKIENSSLFDVVRGSELLEEAQKDFQDAPTLGEVKDLSIWEDYLTHIFSFIDLKKLSPFKVVIDASNGVASKAIALVKEKLPIEIVPLNFNIDGNFPAHEPNPLLEESSKEAKKRVVEEKADFGFIFDGDGDRIFLIDEKGNLVRSDMLLLALSEYFLRKCPGKGIAYNLICSRAVPEGIKKMGGIPLRSKVGFANIRQVLIENGGVFSGEVSGHYSFRDNNYFDSGVIVFLVFLQVISEKNKKVSEIFEEFPKYEISAELNFKAENKEELLEKAKKKYKDGKQDYLDGVTIDYEDWWFNLRPSNTEPLLRLTVEAKDKKTLDKRIKEIQKKIGL